MPKKGKGRKGKGKDDSSGSSSARQTGQQQPGPSTQEAGRGHKEKGKDDSSGSSAQQTGQQPGPSTQEAGRGRGRGKGPPSQTSFPRSPGIQQEKDAATVDPGREKGESSQSRILEYPKIQEQKVAPKGHGRGRGVPPQSSTQQFPGILQQKDVSEDISASATGGASSQDTSVKKKVLPKDEQESLLSQVAGISLEHRAPVNFPFAKRRGYARIDERNRIKLYVNYFKLDYKDDIVIYHYDIDIMDKKENKIGKSVFSEGRTAKEDIKKKVKFIEREKRRNMGKAKCRQIISEAFKTNEVLRKFCPVYDGQKNLFTSRPLPCKKATTFPVDILIEGKKKSFFVKITPVEKDDKTNEISLEPLKGLYSGRSTEIPYEVLLVYETVMSHREPPFEQVQFRNSFFSLRDNNRSPLGCGLEVWFGYHQAVQLTELGPVVLINLAAKAFHKAGPVIDYANDVLVRDDIRKLPKLQRWQIASLTEALRGVSIKVTHQKVPRRYKIKAVTEESAKDIFLDNDRISVVQYFLEKYQKKLLYPNLPCLHMQTINKTFIPMETCEIVEGQPKVGKLSADLTSKMIRGAAVPPMKRMDSIKKTAITVNDTSRKYMGAFGLLMDIKLMKVDGRIMAAPQLAYAGNVNDVSRIAKPDIKGVWRIEDGKKFYKIVKINKWSLISFADERHFGRDILSKYCQFLVQSARKCGMQLDRPQSIDIFGREVSSEEALRRAKQSGAEFVIVVLNRRDNHHSYDEVKFLADFKLNLVTQCMEDKTLSRINDQITTNVCLKINVKLGGINHILLHKPQIFGQPVIVFGIDAIHWPRDYGYPSIVSVVGSLNPTASRYALTCDLQRNDKTEKISQEIIKDMSKLAKEILEIFRDTNNGMFPHKIIIFRDGVSEGQFQHALNYEVSGIQEACRELFQKVIPITFLVVQKRHHTRFFPVNPSQGIGRNQNVPPGTSVDKEITHPVFFDFFICSHEGIQGTSKPAHYTVLHDDNKFQTEELQQLCYFLCHTYVRCTRSVSLPAPVMYADLAAARAKKYADLFTASDTRSVGSEDAQKDLPPQVVKAIRSMKIYENNMFYI